MNFFTVQSLSTYTKNLGMQMKWQKKKNTGDFTADGSTNMADPVRQQAEQIRKSKSDGSDQLSRQIELKLNSGQKLTAEEMNYLQKHDPQTYQRVKAMEAEQESYEKELKRCKTKEEVERVKMAHTATSLNAVNSIKNNPAIPEEKKLELILHEHRKNAALQESAREFVESGKYAKLPTEAERFKAEKDLEEAREAELGIQDPAEKAEEKADTDGEREKVQDGKTEEHVPSGEAGERIFAESLAAKSAAKMKSPEKERELTRMEAEMTPEARKVRRAKAQAAYRANEAEIMPGRTLNVKVE